MRERGEVERDRLRSEGSRLIDEIRREGSAIIEDLRSQAKGRRELSQIISGAGARLDTVAPPPQEVAEADREPLKVGDQVELGDIRGELLTLEPGKAVVGRGGLRIEVAPERLRRARQSTLERRAPRVTVSTAENHRDEVNVLGLRTGEALRKVEEFLDQAYLTNQHEVRIVHGIGSGALKKAIQDYLGTSPYCAGFRQAEPHSGGAGVTIVQIRE
jgi:DNA mismatch repair protein MutS2